MPITLKNLVASLRPKDEELRMLGDTPISIAGCIGRVDETLDLHLALSRLTAPGRTAAIDLRDAGLIIADGATGSLSIDRLPENAFERRLLRECLGLAHNRSDR
jgi:hypothetical protein